MHRRRPERRAPPPARILALSDLDVEAPAPDEDDLEVEDDVAVGDTVRVAVAEGETEIDLSCGFLGSCQARLVAE